jgi:hypothetical protein
MSTSPVMPQMNESEAGETTLFDSLARLVPPELQTDYYRVLAHTHTLGPDDEMLRILEAMGILALVTRHTPKDIADERERIQEMLDCHLQFSDKSQQKMLGYVHFIEGRLSELPSEIEAGLDPQQIAKILGESLRQHFVQSGVPDTVAGLQATTAAMANAQMKLTRAITELSDSHGGVVAQVESANRRIAHTLNERIKALDAFMGDFKTDLLHIWIPLATGATMLIGLFAGMQIQGCRDLNSGNSSNPQAVPHLASPTSAADPTPKSVNSAGASPSRKKRRH